MAGQHSDSQGVLHSIKARLLQEAFALSEAVSHIGNKEAQAESGLDESARQTQSQLAQVLDEVAQGLNDFEANLLGAPVLDALLQALDKRLGEYQAAAESMVNGVLQDSQTIGSSVIVALQSDIRGFMSEVSHTQAALCIEAVQLQTAMKDQLTLDLHAQAMKADIHLQEQHDLHETVMDILAWSFGAIMQDVTSILLTEHAGSCQSISAIVQGAEHLAVEFSHLQQTVLQTMSRWEEGAARSRIVQQEEVQLREVLTEKYNTDNRRLVTEVALLNANLTECRQQLEQSGEGGQRLVEDVLAARMLADELRYQLQQKSAALQSCNEALAASQAGDVEKLRAAEVQSLASNQLLQLSQDQVQDLRAACKVSRQHLQAAQQDIAVGLAREAELQARHDNAEYSSISRDAVIDTHAAELHHAVHLQLCAKAGVMAVSQDATSMMTLLSETLQGCRVELGITKGILLEALEVTRTTCLAVIGEVQQHLGALSRKAETERSHSLSIKQREQLQWEKDVRDQEKIIQALTTHQAECAALAEQWRAKHDLQVEQNNVICHAAAEQLERVKGSTVAHEQEINSMLARLTEVGEDWSSKMASETQQAELQLNLLNKSWENRLEDCCALQKQQEQDFESAQALLIQQHEAEVASLHDALSAERHLHACSLEAQQASHNEELAELRRNNTDDHHDIIELNVAACTAIEEKGAAEVAAAVERADARHRDALQQVSKHHAAMVMELEAACQDETARARLQVENLKTESDKAARALVQQWQRRCDDMQQGMLAAHAAEHAVMQTAHDVALSHMQEDHAALVATLQAEAGRLQEALVSQQVALQVAKAEQHMALTSLQGSLTADHQAAMDSLAELCRREVAEQADTAATQLQAAAATHAAALDAARKAALEQRLQHEAQVQDLQEQLTAVQVLFDNRYPRKEDVGRIRELKSTLAEKITQTADLQKQVGERDSSLQRLKSELLLREDNYNKTFANGGAGLRVLDVSQTMSAQQSVTDWMLKPSSPNRKGLAAQKAQQGTAKK